MLQRHSFLALLSLSFLAATGAKPQYECPGSCPVSCYPQCNQQCCAVGSPNPPPISDSQQQQLLAAPGIPAANALSPAISHRPLSLSEMDKISEKTAVGCEEDKLFLKCKNKFDNLAILSTFYGRDDSVTCFSHVVDSSSKCEQHADYVSKKVQDLCTGENRCKVPVTADFLAKNGEENCPGIRKYLKVIYRCSQHPQIAQICPSGCNSRCWPLCARDCCSPPPPPAPPPVPMAPIVPPQIQAQPQPAPQMTISQALMQAPAPVPAPVSNPAPVSLMPAAQPMCSAQCSPSCAPQCLPSCCNGVPTGISSPSIALSQMPPLQQQPVYQENFAQPVQQAPAPNYGCPSVCQSSCQQGCPQICCRRSQIPPSALLRSRVAANARALAAMSGGYHSRYGGAANGNYRSRILSQRRTYNPQAYYPRSNAFPNAALARSRQYAQYQRYGNRVP